MGKLIMSLLIGLVLGISGGGFFGVYKAAAAHTAAVTNAQKHGLKPVADSAHAADSNRHGAPEHGAQAVATAAAHDSTPSPVASATTPAEPTAAADHAPVTAHVTPVVTKPSTAPAAAVPPTVTKPVAAKPAEAAGTVDTETEAHQKRLAKIFATMSAKDASRVLAQMTDHDVAVILNLLTSKQTAAILTNLPAPRAATLAQMQPKRSGDDE